MIAAGSEVSHHLDQLETWIAGLGATGPALFVLLFVVGSTLLVPESVLCLVGGALFGVGEGFAAALTGSLLANTLQYFLARHLLQGPIERLVLARPKAAAIRRALGHDELRLQVLLRLAPLNPALVSYLLGAAGVAIRGFIVACLALIPHLALELWLGAAGVRLARMAGGGSAGRTRDLLVALGALAAIAAVVVFSRIARRAVQRALDDAGPPPTP
ncbi:TVP38/TMEM64 family protein [Engelhardtia mirabilis]|uniref:TVP38/TMEM64 family membrane protein n=1 Tax=Engelhardtia mirabilis TaxID=2528011 RepID=A0A518BEK9_9BACT|nr:SNARE associated Golgi protein [Planctomycetes bacterium Pla133]QDU99649.1 SNARE associated Golgi protein [Planctomycetes bacterium Pla86]